MKIRIENTRSPVTQPCPNAYLEAEKDGKGEEECLRAVWYVDISTLEELLSKIPKTGSLVLYRCDDKVMINRSEVKK